MDWITVTSTIAVLWFYLGCISAIMIHVKIDVVLWKAILFLSLAPIIYPLILLTTFFDKANDGEENEYENYDQN